MFRGCLEDVYRAFFLRECCVAGNVVCQGFCCLSGTIILQGLLLFFAKDCYCRAMHCSINRSIIVSAVLHGSMLTLVLNLFSHVSERRRGVVQERQRRGKVRAVLMLSVC
jgi:hypothetical protein